ncbi:MAG TPA: glycoside hydrolase 43 family protein, partial [Sphingomicrobium sp.]
MISAVLLAGSVPLLASMPERPWGFWQSWGDQGNGTYRNPVLPADFSDLDAIRVGGDYYAISSTLHVSPGMAVLHSNDLVNWRMIGHVVPDVTVLGPEYRWDQMKRFGRGVWAGTIRHHAGNFWVFFGTPDEGLFMATARNPAGPWSPLHPLLKGAGWDDPAVLWDDDGKAYFLATNFADGYKSYIMPMSADGRSIDRSKTVLVNEGRGREASKLLKVDGYYYLIFSEHVPGKGRYVVGRRARHPMGPWSAIKQLAEPGLAAKEPNQGGILQAPSGKYYFFTHHGSQDWEG